MQVCHFVCNQQENSDLFFFEINFEYDTLRFLLCQHFGNDGWATWYDVLVTELGSRNGPMEGGIKFVVSNCFYKTFEHFPLNGSIITVQLPKAVTNCNET